MPILLALAAAAATPQPGELKTFQDWTVGCDNGRACQAVALLTENGLEGVTLVLRRAAGGAAAPRAFFAINDGRPARADLGGRVLALNEGAVAPVDIPALLTALRIAAAIPVRDGAGKAIGAVSLRGASAAMLYMDDRQGRAGTVTALVRPGSRPARAVPAPPPLPIIAATRASAAANPRFSRSHISDRLTDAGCENVATPADLEVVRLDTASTLALLPDRCGSGAYNLYSLALIVDNRGRIRPAIFDAAPGMSPEPGDSTIVNGNWDRKTRRLSTFAKGRGIGDCGTRQSFAWDGRRFRLAHQEAMGECRGSTDYITTWRAVVR